MSDVPNKFIVSNSQAVNEQEIKKMKKQHIQVARTDKSFKDTNLWKRSHRDGGRCGRARTTSKSAHRTLVAPEYLKNIQTIIERQNYGDVLVARLLIVSPSGFRIKLVDEVLPSNDGAVTKELLLKRLNNRHRKQNHRKKLRTHQKLSTLPSRYCRHRSSPKLEPNARLRASLVLQPKPKEILECITPRSSLLLYGLVNGYSNALLVRTASFQAKSEKETLTILEIQTD